MQLFEYAVWKDEKRDKQTDAVVDKAEVLVEPTTVLAGSEDQVGMIAARQIPAEHMEDEDSMRRVKIVIRPF